MLFAQTWLPRRVGTKKKKKKKRKKGCKEKFFFSFFSDLPKRPSLTEISYMYTDTPPNWTRCFHHLLVRKAIALTSLARGRLQDIRLTKNKRVYLYALGV